MSETAPPYGDGTRSLADQAYDRVEELIKRGEDATRALLPEIKKLLTD